MGMNFLFGGPAGGDGMGGDRYSVGMWPSSGGGVSWQLCFGFRPPPLIPPAFLPSRIQPTTIYLIFLLYVYQNQPKVVQSKKHTDIQYWVIVVKHKRRLGILLWNTSKGCAWIAPHPFLWGGIPVFFSGFAISIDTALYFCQILIEALPLIIHNLFGVGS